jgi:hemerythrin superfamily protein
MWKASDGRIIDEVFKDLNKYNTNDIIVEEFGSFYKTLINFI